MLAGVSTRRYRRIQEPVGEEVEQRDGTVYREESKAMEETIRAGKLFEKSQTGVAAASAAAGRSGENPPT